MGLFHGWLYCFLWYSSIMAGYAMFCPLLPVLFISNKFYRTCTDALFSFWQLYPTVLLELVCGCDIQVSGDAIKTDETSLIVMNHRTRTDWNFLWPTMYHCVSGRGKFKFPTKYVLKDVIRHIPGPGWVMQLACFVFIKRCWVLDKLTLGKAIDYFSNLKYKYSLLIFPEGTDFTTSTKAKSDDYAKKNDFECYDYVLHPRTTGFVFLAKEMLEKKALDAVYDVTLVYPDLVPQNEAILLKGNFPKQVKVHLARYPSTILPKTGSGLGEFLKKRWLDKDRTLREYHSTGQFLHGQILKTQNRFELIFALFFWTLLPFFVIYLLYLSLWYRLVIVLHTIFLIFVNVAMDGFQNFEIGWYRFKKFLFRFK
ncbi:lysocardiolipin acyltransferase 1-like [Tribolium madens]|uniref:lysocardiolipin acyltransferase 1-like n=1 Tax=Tribolium madens TaxID=41895 RepID=UPI001CF75B6F|nr:lysocardiolipin acyltransferase 1-like [Tribolium madens]